MQKYISVNHQNTLKPKSAVNNSEKNTHNFFHQDFSMGELGVSASFSSHIETVS